MKTTKVVIFDWLRTLYNPERQKLMPGALRLCRKLATRGVTLGIVSRGEPRPTGVPERKRQIRESAVAKYCSTLSVEKQKSPRQFRRILKKFPAGTTTFVVGDRIKEEIKMGNLLGLTTIWLKKGKFRKEVPTSACERPDFVIKNLAEAWPIIVPPR
ncbi:MAG: HAD hydrolase-like protein [bacterium]|nr:HAD hydrolase-like protein [bacterium]